MISGTGLTIGPGNFPHSRWILYLSKKEKEKEKKKKILFLPNQSKVTLLFSSFFLKVSSRSCYWWNCLPWIDIDRRNPMEVGIWKYKKELNTIDFVPPFWFWIWCILL